ncbi:hypothetical protein CWATWH8502_2300 [Crocosphaera watsonii WH 8502]|uniref:Uncharacterized protein n=2 Tax=Crocosphaera watsonii TaxID=263511 RepID=T2JC23_CROWT|nr:hypothetical protein CWATWH8502_2300 [Crocosphaera watsonii WH 8502]CCQ62589.1 hypothetical protein CWATWH0401_3082 [Crocosphaera watsonii WH 0401]
MLFSLAIPIIKDFRLKRIANLKEMWGTNFGRVDPDVIA